ncbi:MAG: biotin/lipoyl-containing protein, partial [Phaeospirillum sp.]|nr:biotin/lipoyl-containing protein [Phaeospirillum sp.]
KAGEALAVIEAMKMENILKAERDGTIAKLHAKAGDSLAVDQKIIEFEGKLRDGDGPAALAIMTVL